MSRNEQAAGKTAKVISGAIRAEVGSEYDERARAFLAKTGARMSARYLGDFPAEWDERGGYHPKYNITITSAAGKMRLAFYGSIADHREGRDTVTAYDVLACLTKYEPGTFDEFCEEFGYFPIESGAAYRKAVKTWRACRREFAGVCRVWPDEADREALAEIA